MTPEPGPMAYAGQPAPAHTRRARGGMVRLCLLGALVGALVTGSNGIAQTPPATPGRLTVRPHAIALGTDTARAGEHAFDSLPGSWVYVPQQCIGPRRCPLLVFLDRPQFGHALVDGDPDPDSVATGTTLGLARLQQRWAEEYGIILLSPPAVTGPPGMSFESDSQDSFLVDELSDSVAADVEVVDVALQQVLRTLAIDPDKIAVAGNQESGNFAVFLGSANADVFSRVAAIGMKANTLAAGPRSATTQFYLSAGLNLESSVAGSTTAFVPYGPLLPQHPYLEGPLRVAQRLRRVGYPVQVRLGFRGIMSTQVMVEQDSEEYALLWRWLAESWTMPTPTAPSDPDAGATADPLLTPRAISQLTAFWTRFLQLSDSIRITARLAHRRHVTILVGQEREPMVVTLVDLPALAAQEPAVAAALASARLTAAQADAYRIALIRAKATLLVGPLLAPLDPTSVLGQNVAFLGLQQRALAALGATGMWFTP